MGPGWVHADLAQGLGTQMSRSLPAPPTPAWNLKCYECPSTRPRHPQAKGRSTWQPLGLGKPRLQQ